jgi:hypothetical protein
MAETLCLFRFLKINNHRLEPIPRSRPRNHSLPAATPFRRAKPDPVSFRHQLADCALVPTGGFARLLRTLLGRLGTALLLRFCPASLVILSAKDARSMRHCGRSAPQRVYQRSAAVRPRSADAPRFSSCWEAICAEAAALRSFPARRLASAIRVSANRAASSNSAMCRPAGFQRSPPHSEIHDSMAAFSLVRASAVAKAATAT